MLARNTLAIVVALAILGCASAAFAGNGWQQALRGFSGNGGGSKAQAQSKGQGQGNGNGNGGQKALNILLNVQRGLQGNQGFGNQQQCHGNQNCNQRPCNNNPLPQAEPAPTEETPPTEVPAEEGAPTEEPTGETPTGEETTDPTGEAPQFKLLPGQKMTFQVEAENRPGSGFAKLVRNLGTFSTQEKADQIAAIYRSEGYGVRITSMPVTAAKTALAAKTATAAKVVAKPAAK